MPTGLLKVSVIIIDLNIMYILVSIKALRAYGVNKVSVIIIDINMMYILVSIKTLRAYGVIKSKCYYNRS